MPSNALSGRVALVTGAASGIGRAAAERFAAEGAAVVGLDSVPEPDFWPALNASAKGETFWRCDVRDEPALERAVSEIVSRHARIDVLLNAAGVSSGGPSEDIDAAEWDRVLDINLKGTFLAAKQALRQAMLAQGAGNIVNIASIEGLEGLTSQAAYGASKGAVVQLTRNLAVDYALMGIRVNCVCPGAIDTPMTAVMKTPELQHAYDQLEAEHLMQRFGRPEEVAAAILFLASDESSFVTGHALVVDGGYTAGRRFNYGPPPGS